MINLNDFKGTPSSEEFKFFNGGKAGRAENITLSAVKKTPEDAENAPDFNIIFTDPDGGWIKEGFYYPNDRSNDTGIRIDLQKLVGMLHIVKPSTKEKELPQFENYKQAYDFLFKQLSTAEKVPFNLFVNYGTVSRPSTRLQIRTFNFIEPSSVTAEESKLTPIKRTDERSKYNDLMERITPTEFSSNNGSFESTTTNDDGLDDW